MYQIEVFTPLRGDHDRPVPFSRLRLTWYNLPKGLPENGIDVGTGRLPGKSAAPSRLLGSFAVTFGDPFVSQDMEQDWARGVAQSVLARHAVSAYTL